MYNIEIINQFQKNEEINQKTSKIDEGVNFFQNQIDQLSELYKNKIQEKEKQLQDEKKFSEVARNNEDNLKKLINDQLNTISNYKKQYDM